MKCKAGDLAIVIDDINPENIGRIVNVIRLQNKTDEIQLKDQGIVWHVTSFDNMTWTVGNKTHHAHAGPVPDDFLHPIRGNSKIEMNEHQSPKRRICLSIHLRNAEINNVSPDTWKIERSDE